MNLRIIIYILADDGAFEGWYNKIEFRDCKKLYRLLAKTRFSADILLKMVWYNQTLREK